MIFSEIVVLVIISLRDRTLEQQDKVCVVGVRLYGMILCLCFVAVPVLRPYVCNQLVTDFSLSPTFTLGQELALVTNPFVLPRAARYDLDNK
jgi:hypothetical protein